LGIGWGCERECECVGWVVVIGDSTHPPTFAFRACTHDNNTPRIRRARQMAEEQFSYPTSTISTTSSRPDRPQQEKEGEQGAALVPTTTTTEGGEGGGGVGPLLSRVPADGRTYQILVRMLVRAKRLGEAFDVVKTMRREKGAWSVLCGWWWCGVWWLGWGWGARGFGSGFGRGGWVYVRVCVALCPCS
jgi:pentatricopeptide repeat protein